VWGGRESNPEQSTSCQRHSRATATHVLRYRELPPRVPVSPGCLMPLLPKYGWIYYLCVAKHKRNKICKEKFSERRSVCLKQSETIGKCQMQPSRNSRSIHLTCNISISNNTVATTLIQVVMANRMRLVRRR
jgi:hypothetical protein